MIYLKGYIYVILIFVFYRGKVPFKNLNNFKLEAFVTLLNKSEKLNKQKFDMMEIIFTIFYYCSKQLYLN